MEIIKKGEDPRNKTYDWTCSECKAVVRAARHEGRFVADQHDGDAVVFECPQCGRENWVAVSLFR